MYYLTASGSGTCEQLSRVALTRVSHEVAVKMLPRAVLFEDLTGAEEAASSVAHSWSAGQEAPGSSGLAGDLSSPQAPLVGWLQCSHDVTAGVFPEWVTWVSKGAEESMAPFMFKISGKWHKVALKQALMRSDLLSHTQGGELSPTSLERIHIKECVLYTKIFTGVWERGSFLSLCPVDIWAQGTCVLT